MTFQHLLNNNKMYVFSFYIHFFHCCCKGLGKRKKMRLILFFLLSISELFNKYNLIAGFESLINIAIVSNLIDITNV
jgi:hypothetical protein